MRSSPYPTSSRPATKPRPPPRKKACKNCTRSKVRCGQERPACSRCRSQGRDCEYSALAPAPAPTPDVSVGSEARSPAGINYDGSGGQASLYLGSSVIETPSLCPAPGISFLSYSSPETAWEGPSRSWRGVGGGEGSRETGVHPLDFSSATLIPSAHAEDIRDRWLRPYILPPLGREEISKTYHPFTLQYISRVLSTYPRSMIKEGDAPPFIHRAQLKSQEMPRSLANCYTLVRMWEQAAPGSEAMVVETVEKEMERLTQESQTSNLHDYELLSAFQAYLIYAMMMYFSPLKGASPITEKTMITLMEMAFLTARNGLVCAAENSHIRPTWESWILAAAKRRAIFAMYMFTSVYNADRQLPNFLADEMRGVYAPGNKALWEASDPESWGREYDRYLLDWQDGALDISELWRSEETGSAERRRRVERWVQSVDEFGMFIFAVCAHIHGC